MSLAAPRRSVGWVPLLLLASQPLAASQLSLLRSQGTGGDRPQVWAEVKNLEAGGRSGSLRLQYRLATAPHGQQGRYYTVGTGPTEDGLPAGYSRRLAFTMPFDSSTYAAGTYYQNVVVQEYDRGRWVDRAGTTYEQQYTVRSRPAAARQPPVQRLRLGEWQWRIANGQATASADIINNGSAASGTLRLELKLCDQPFGKGGSCYVAGRSGNLSPINGGYHRTSSLAAAVDLSRFQPGTYHAVLVLKEYTGEGKDGYAVQAGDTSTAVATVNASSAASTRRPTASAPTSSAPGHPAAPADDEDDDDDDDEEEE